MYAHNTELSRIFHDMSSMYSYLGQAERFRALAFRKVARVLPGLEHDIADYADEGTLEAIPGIGKSIAEDIGEYLQTGSIKKYEELKKQVPFDLMELMDVKGFGPGLLKQLCTGLKLSTRKEVIEALEDGRIGKLKGFGEAKVKNLMRGLKLHKTLEERMLLWEAMETGERLINLLKQMPEVIHAELAGSLRRKKETIGDFDILICCREKNRVKVSRRFTSSDIASQTLASGNTKVSIILKESGKQADLRLISEQEWGAALLYFTGSKEHNIHLRSIAKARGCKINEYGLYRLSDNKCLAGTTEEEIYSALGLAFIPPEMREDRGEIKLAAQNKIPSIISLEDIRGDFQMHSKWSDGALDPEELAAFLLKHSSYEYAVITDHSVSQRVAGGLTEKKFGQQIDLIKRINKKLTRNFLKSGVEVDILSDGSLDISDQLLSRFDWVCASVHTGFTKDNTDRLIQACLNPYVHCIGHPQGRLIGRREAYQVNWPKVFDTAAQTGTAMEINAQPERMDLNDELARQAKEAGVKLVLSTDSHQPGDFAFMKLAVSIAQRAWCTKANILNSETWSTIESFCHQKKQSTKPGTKKIFAEAIPH